MLLVPFERTFTEDQQNKGLAEELKRELPAIFNWAYEGMVELEENGFVVPAKCAEAIEQYRRDANPAKVFLRENYHENPEAEGVPCGGGSSCPFFTPCELIHKSNFRTSVSH